MPELNPTTAPPIIDTSLEVSEMKDKTTYFIGEKKEIAFKINGVNKYFLSTTNLNPRGLRLNMNFEEIVCLYFCLKDHLIPRTSEYRREVAVEMINNHRSIFEDLNADQGIAELLCEKVISTEDILSARTLNEFGEYVKVLASE